MGLGFFTVEGVGKDHSVHVSELVDEVRKGDEVKNDFRHCVLIFNDIHFKFVILLS